jgi:hypothetical protein
MHRVIFLIFILMIIFCRAQDAQKNDLSFQEPVLITSAGQSSDVLMAQVLAGKINLQIDFQKQVQSDQIDSAKSIIIVCGGSVKGMGAAGIDKDAEYGRVERILKRARELKIPVIGMHVGGKSRRGALSDYFNKLVADYADYLIVVKEGNEDKFFTKIADTRNIPCDIVDKIISIQDNLKTLYKK